MTAALFALTVTVISPKAATPDAVDAAAGLGQALELALANDPRYQAVGDTPLLPTELVTAFDCRQLDVSCAARAGEAAGTDLVVLAVLTPREGGLQVELAMVEVRAPGSVRRVRRLVRSQGNLGEQPEDPLTTAWRYLVEALLDDRGETGSELLLVGASGVLADRAIDAGRVASVDPGSMALEFDGGEANVEIHPTELLVYAPPPNVKTSYARPVAGWMLVGLGSAALAGAGTSGILMARSQTHYEHAHDGLEMQTFAEEGQTQAAVANVLLASGVLVLTAGVVLLLVDGAPSTSEGGTRE